MFLVLASFTDPGIIPQVIATEDEKVPKRNALDNLTQATQGFAFETNTFSVSTRFCKICRIYRPPRAAHCFECHHCVEKFDHHCPWIGVCVGRKNYFFFFVYVASIFGLLVSNVAVGIWFVIRLGVDLDQTFTRSKDIAFMTITSFFVLASLGVALSVRDLRDHAARPPHLANLQKQNDERAPQVVR